MNANVLTVDDAARCLAEVVDHVHESGEPTVLTKFGKPIARIVSVPENGNAPDRLIAFLRQWRIMYPEPDEQFGDAIAESRRSIQPPRDPWE